MINVLIIDAHVLVRQGICLMLSDIKGIRVVGEAGTGEEGLNLKRLNSPDIVILDFQLPDTNGLEVAKKLFRRDPDIKILVVTAIKSELILFEFLELGVQGFITKNSPSVELERAIRAVHSGQRYVSPTIGDRSFLNRNESSPFNQLSQREIQVLLLLAKGVSVKDIAKQLSITSKTVNGYRYNMFEKLGVKNDVGLIRLAMRYGLIEVDGVLV